MRWTELFETTETLTLWHGGRNLESDYLEFRSHRSGSWEHGPGLYLTATRDVAAKYAKGGNAMYRVTVQLERNIDEVMVTFDECKAFATKFVKGSSRKEFMQLCQRSFERRNAVTVPIDTLMNLSLNLNAVQHTKTGEIRRWLTDKGVGYIHVPNYGGWGVEKGNVYVIVDPKLIKKVVRERD